MSYKSLPLCMLLIKDDAKAMNVFQSALINLGSKNPISLYQNIELCLQHLKEVPNIVTPILFFYLNENVRKCINEIVTIRKDLKNKDLSIVVYDSTAAFCDEDIFMAGANIYIKKSNDIIKLNKIIKNAMNMNGQFELGQFNRDTFFLSV
ncbi:hypothetical protein HNQ02_001358 [Flavobacterium sp. 7E]|uniref:hypothetical protein n=1 Tax=unclassified Flavobacterium TaxID=196869 RepID=UPI001571037F|nr:MULTISPECIES: hypothetical protein [unclassified Flavobacterium]MBE0391890.1 hypothetical protein [Flavobacterium sp. PL002]NRS88444.1 hypothetical protein [Flavobacterium sp. 7E]